MAIGGTLFALALVDRLLQVAFGGDWTLDRDASDSAGVSH
jgi:hypothetical protein